MTRWWSGLVSDRPTCWDALNNLLRMVRAKSSIQGICKSPLTFTACSFALCEQPRPLSMKRQACNVTWQVFFISFRTVGSTCCEWFLSKCSLYQIFCSYEKLKERNEEGINLVENSFVICELQIIGLFTAKTDSYLCTWHCLTMCSLFSASSLYI